MAGSLSGCTYENFVKRDVKIPYVFVPPSKDFTPYSIVAYNDDENFQTVCPASILIGQMSMDEFTKTYLDDSKGNPVGSIGVSESASYAVKVDLTSTEVAEIGAQYAGRYKATMNLKNGKVFTVNDSRFSIGSLFLAMKENEKCLLNLAGFIGSSKKYRYILVNSVFRYDTDFTLESTTSASVTLTPAVQELLLRKASFELGKSTAKSIDAPSLYIGFRGLDQVPPDDTGKRAESLRQARLASDKAADEAKAAEAKAIAAGAAQKAAEARGIVYAKTAIDAKARAAAQTEAAEEAKKAEKIKEEAEKTALAAKATEVAIAASTIAPSLATETGAAQSTNPQDQVISSVPSSQANMAGTVLAATDDHVPPSVKALDVTALIETLATSEAPRKADSPSSAIPLPAPTSDLPAPGASR